MGKLRLGLVRSFAKLTQLRNTMQNQHSPLGLSDMWILLSVSKLLDLFGKWKEQRLRAEETNVFELLRQVWCLSPPRQGPGGWERGLFFPTFPTSIWDFPGGPVAKALCSQCRWSRFHSWSRNEILHTTTKSSYWWCCLVAKSCLTLWDPMDCSLPGSSVHGISWARILEWVATSFSRGSSWPRAQTHVSWTGRRILYHWTTREACSSRASTKRSFSML